MEWNYCGHLGFQIDTILSPFDLSHPVATEQLLAQSNQRSGKNCRKLIFKMASVVAILDSLLAHLAILCLLSTLMLIIIWIQLDYRGIQYMPYPIYAHLWAGTDRQTHR